MDESKIGVVESGGSGFHSNCTFTNSTNTNIFFIIVFCNIFLHHACLPYILTLHFQLNVHYLPPSSTFSLRPSFKVNLYHHDTQIKMAIGTGLVVVDVFVIRRCPKAAHSLVVVRLFFLQVLDSLTMRLVAA